MCGIHGIITDYLTENEIRRRLEDMGVLQVHRGPDDRKETVFYLDKGMLGFGFRRLSILDLETGMQPIISAVNQVPITKHRVLQFARSSIWPLL